MAAHREGVWTEREGQQQATAITRPAVVASRRSSMFDLVHGWTYCTHRIPNRPPCRNREMHPGKLSVEETVNIIGMYHHYSRADGRSTCT